MTRTAELRARLDELAAAGDSAEHVDVLNALAETCLAGEPQPMFEFADQAIAMARRLGYPRGEGYGLFFRGTAHWLVARLELAMATLLEADAIFHAQADRAGRARVRAISGAVYRSLGAYDQAFLEGLEALEFFETQDDLRWEMLARLSLGMTSHELGDFEGARKQYEQILEVEGRVEQPWVVGRALSGIGAAEDALGHHREALGFHLRALKKCESVSYRMGQARALHEIGQSYERLGDRTAAIDSYERSLRLREEIDQREAQCSSLVALGRLWIGSDRDRALGYLHRALEVAEASGAKPRVYQSHLVLSQVHEHYGDPVKALAHYKAYHAAHTEVVEFTSGVRVRNLRTVFDADKQAREAELARLKASLEEHASLGSYRLVQRLGAGGMSEVWRGEHRLLARPAAIKVIRGQADGTPEYEQRVHRLRREAEVTASLRSPHTVQLFDFGVSDGTFHYVMELLDGMDARQMVERFGPLPPARLVYVLRQVCRSLAEAHEHGLVHRDIKPANLFVAVLGGEYDYLKVLDFGIVKTTSEETDLQLTVAGGLVGTPAFVAPELVRDTGAADGRADLYSLACSAFWMLTGRPVFEANSPTALLMAHVGDRPPAVSARASQPIPPALDALIAGCLEKDAAARPASAMDLYDRLGAIDCGEPWTGDCARDWWLAHVPAAGAASPS